MNIKLVFYKFVKVNLKVIFGEFLYIMNKVECQISTKKIACFNFYEHKFNTKLL
jgi:hypothetical protein